MVMENLFENKVYLDNFDHELKINDPVEWITSGHTLIGRIIGFENDKAIIQTTACRYKDDEELEEIKKKAKRQYKVTTHRLFLLVPKDFYKKTA